MQILVVADLHYSLKQFDWLCDVAGRFDLVIIAGDLLDLAGHAELDTQIVVVVKYLHRIREKTPLVVCSGNHDGDTKNEGDEYIAQWIRELRSEGLYVDGESVELNAGLLTVCPWWDGPITRAEMASFLEEEKARPRKLWIWVHHAPPDDSPVSWTRKGNAGDAFLREAVGEHMPDLVFSGHIHNSPFREEGSWFDRIGRTWVFNTGRQLAYYPSHIVVDLDAMTAKWISEMDVEEIDLSAGS